MAKLAASEAATAISHQVSPGPMGVALSPAAHRVPPLSFPGVGDFSLLVLFSLLGHPDPGRHGVRDGDASRAVLSRRPHHRDLRGHQRNPETGDRGAPAAELPELSPLGGQPARGPRRRTGRASWLSFEAWSHHKGTSLILNPPSQTGGTSVSGRGKAGRCDP